MRAALNSWEHLISLVELGRQPICSWDLSTRCLQCLWEPRRHGAMQFASPQSCRLFLKRSCVLPVWIWVPHCVCTQALRSHWKRKCPWRPWRPRASGTFSQAMAQIGLELCLKGWLFLADSSSRRMLFCKCISYTKWPVSSLVHFTDSGNHSTV